MKATKLALFLLFLLSGFSGLIYESVWSHYIKLILGHAAYAQTLVLAIFMGGMALGAWLISRKASHLKNPLLGYAVVELIIGLFGIGFHAEFIIAKDFLFGTLLPLTESTLLASILKWLVAALLLLPQAVLLGTTFPLISAAVIRMDTKNSGHTLSMLYFTNSLGAVLGVLASAFIFIKHVGLPGTSFTAGLINIILAVIILPIARELKNSAPVQASGNTATTSSTHSLLLLIAFFTGVASFFYEIGWIRMLSLVLGSSTQAFELMLSAFILGLALGSLLIRKHADKNTNNLLLLAWIQIAMGLLATATIPLYSHSFTLMSQLRQALTPTDFGYGLFNIGSHLIALIIMLPATLMAGMTLPLITNYLIKNTRNNEASIGRVYAANTLGAILAIVLAVNILMPLVGTKYLIITGGLIDVILGIVILKKFVRTKKLYFASATPLIASLAAIVFFSTTQLDQSILSSGVYRFGNAKLNDNATPVFYHDGKTATISVIQYDNNKTSIRTNGKTDALISPPEQPFSSDEATMILAALLPLAYHPQAENIANIGMGSGLTSHAMLANPNINYVDTIEIEQGIVDGAALFGDSVHRVFTDSRSHIYIDDAKSFFSVARKKYDIIISEPSNPWVSGVSSLFTAEFYQHIQQYLSQNGIFVQWIQLYETNISNIASVTKALDTVFTDYKIYNTDDTNLLLIASPNKPLSAVDPWIFEHPDMQQQLQRIGVEQLDDLSIRYLGSKSSLAELLAEIPASVNSDFYPALSYNAPVSFFKQENALEMTSLHTAPIPVIAWTNNTPPITKLSSQGNYFTTYNKHRIAKQVINYAITDNNLDKLTFAVRIIQNQLIACQQPLNADATLQDSLYSVAVSINPYLSAKELNVYWNQLLTRCPANSLSDNERRWLQLHAAIGNKQLDNIISLANAILQSQQPLDNHEYQYLFGSVLLANILNHTPTDSMPLLQHFYRNRLYPQAPLYLKYLIGLTLPLTGNHSIQ